MPGRVDHPRARGCHRPLHEGATLIETPDELVLELGLAEVQVETARELTEPGGGQTGELARSILGALVGETLSLDEVIARVRAPPKQSPSARKRRPARPAT